jgi:Ca-activated chloride channel family protein
VADLPSLCAAPAALSLSPRIVRSAVLHLLLSAALLISNTANARAQDAPTATDDEVLRISTNLITVPVNVWDGRGRRVAGLTREDFELFDEGRRVETTYFAAGAERVALLFLLDASGSTQDILRQQQETALALFSRFGARSRIAVMRFSDTTELTLPFTDDPAQAHASFALPALPNRRTAIFDAGLAAVRAFKDSASSPVERRIVVLLSDGLDTVSTTRAQRVIDEARAQGVSFYVIHLPLYAPRGDRLAPRPPAKGFRDLAEKTGGQFFMVGSVESALDPRVRLDLQPVFKSIADDLAGQYVLGYYAAEQNQGHYRRIEVRLTAARGRKLRLRALREGYKLEE